MYTFVKHTRLVRFLREKLFSKRFRRYCEVRLGIATRESRNRRNKLLAGTATWKDLRNYTKFARYGLPHNDYERIIMSYDPEVCFDDVVDARFMGKGEGLYSLNSYRRVILKIGTDRVHCFEKVYLRDSADYIKMAWFYDEIYPQLQNVLEIPSRILTRGDSLAVVYFQWFDDLATPNRKDIVEAYLHVSDLLDKVHVKKEHQREKVISDFRINTFFSTKPKKARAWLKNNEGVQAIVQLDDICNRIASESPDRSGFVHGDLNKANLTKKGLIDFDYCGFHPKAFEHAAFVTRFFKPESMNGLYKVFESINADPANHDEKLKLLFFCFVFYLRKRRRPNDRFLHLLWKELSEHHLIVQNA